MMDPSQSVGRTPEAEELRRLADDLVALLKTQTPDLTTATQSGLGSGAPYGRTAVSLLQYHFWMADPLTRPD